MNKLFMAFIFSADIQEKQAITGCSKKVKRQPVFSYSFPFKGVIN